MKKGFTLIELLVVITIIGLLAGILMTFLNTARQSGKDSRVVAEMRQFKNIMELKMDSSGNYPRAVDVVLEANSDAQKLRDDICIQQGITSACGTQNISGSKWSGISANGGQGGGTITYYCAWAWLPSDYSKYVCIDSQGGFNKKGTAATPCNATTNVCQ